MTDRRFHIGKVHVNTVYTGPERPNYTVRFVIDGTKCQFSGELEQRVQIGRSAIEPTLIVNSGWRFTGWDKPFNKVTSDLVVTACFQEISQEVKATITWNENGGNSGLIPQQIPVGGRIGNLPLTSRTGYEFDCWRTSNGDLVTVDTIVQGDMEIIAQWTPIEYTIRYDIDGNWINPNTLTKFTIEDEFTPVPAQRTGYSFIRWEPESIQIGTTQDITFHGYGQINTYAITFDDGRTTTSQSHDYGTIVDLTDPNPRNGYSFDGWYTSKTGGTKVEKTLTITQDVTFYAHWNEIQYNIFYNMNGHGVEPSGLKKTYTINESYAPDIVQQNPIGYVFSRWEPESISLGSTGGVEFNAIWNLEEYEIEYDLGGHGELPANAITRYTIESGEIDPPVLQTVNGWAFKGWTPSSIPEGSTGNVKFVASWEEITIHEGETATIRNTMELDVVLTGEDGTDMTLPGKLNESQMGSESETIVKQQQYTIKDCTYSGIEDSNGTIYNVGSTIIVDSDQTLSKHVIETSQAELDQIASKYPLTVEIPDDEHTWQPEINQNEDEEVKFDGTKLKILVTDEYRTFIFHYLETANADSPATIDWGDGNTTVVDTINMNVYSHSYEENGEYAITIDDNIKCIGICGSSNYIGQMVKSIDNLGSNIDSIFDECFRGCEHITSITIPESVQEIGILAFSGCSNLETITCLGKTAPTLSPIDPFIGENGKTEKCGENVMAENRELIIPFGCSGYDEGKWKTTLVDKCGYNVKYFTPEIIVNPEEAYDELSKFYNDLDSFDEYGEEIPEWWEPTRGIIE